MHGQYPYTFKLFGSRARGNYKYNSDIDIVVEGTVIEKDKFNIKNQFDEIETVYTIDLVFIQDIKEEKFKLEIAKEGIEL